MGYIFRPGLHACDASGSLIFLDLPTDRYFALTGRANAACRRLIAGTADADDALIVDELVAKGILAVVPEAAMPSLCQTSMPARASDHSADGVASGGHAMLATMRHAIAIADLKLRGLNSIVAGLRRKKRRMETSRGRRNGNAGKIDAAFRAADRLLTADGRCLTRSFALARAMISNGFEPRLVLGVKLRPFEAHCWVQHGDVLVSDDIETIAPFTPILIV